MPTYILSPQAQNSLKQISHYTRENFGEQQRKSYLKKLHTKMRAAAKEPHKGKDRSDIKAGYFSIKAEKHMIYYRIRGMHIDIIDVLHQSMEPTLHI
ncbi:type II toxin-antitoxin system RelE/ParE family toxin [Agarilytica rhodophyticola]|uniref:type II toxin-antitoxin system RelE/ParE family toxin n=1 Tax=Agarilytica rhodophyticola TaxID=1737490 RepID=UPI000B343A0A|nr:type II toxin-antitoxin system RelE/ParE family toxin [Agarilytica rhodophyticola]